MDELIVGCYVDDLCICHGPTCEKSLYSDFVKALEARFDVEDEGELSDLLGIEFEFSEGHVKLHQKSYIERLVATYLPEGVPSNVQKGSSTPCDVNLPLHLANALSCTDEPDATLVKRYQSRPPDALYHTASDPYEMKNLTANPDHEARKKALSKELLRWMTEEGDPGIKLDTMKAHSAAREGKHLF